MVDIQRRKKHDQKQSQGILELLHSHHQILHQDLNHLVRAPHQNEKALQYQALEILLDSFPREVMENGKLVAW